jgi:Ca2+-binding RTX toxin-like protein
LLLAVPAPSAPAQSGLIGPQNRVSQAGPDGHAGSAATSSSLAWDPANRVYLAVWEGTASDGEFEIFGRFLDPGGVPVSEQLRLSQMGPNGDPAFDAVDPEVVYNPQAGEFLVVWAGNEVGTGNEVWAQRVSAPAGGQIGGDDIRLSQMGPEGSADYGVGHPAVAWNARAGAYLVAWWGDDDGVGLGNDQYEIFAQLLGADESQPGPDDARLSEMGPNGSTAFLAQRPSVAANPASGDWLVAWQGEDDAPPQQNDETEIFVQRVAGNGAEVGSNDVRISDMGPDGNPEYDGAGASVAFSAATGGYLVVWHGDDNSPPLAGDELEIYAQALSATAQEQGANDVRVSTQGPDGEAQFDAVDPVVAASAAGQEFLIAWWGDVGPPLFDDESEVFAQKLLSNGSEIGTDFRVSATVPDQDPNFDASEPAVTHAPELNEYLVSWRADTIVPSTLVDEEFEVYDRRVTAAGAPAAAPAGACKLARAGTGGRDGLTGTPFGDRLFGGSGNDFLVGLEGDDCLLGGRGKDRLDGGPGRDALRGDSGNDRLLGLSGEDKLSGGTANDRLAGGPGNDRVSGGRGADTLRGNGGRDKIIGGTGPDRIYSVDRRVDRVRCGSGRDRARVDRIDRLTRCERVRRVGRRRR